MIQFNLDEYLNNPSIKVITRDGRSVTIKRIDKSLPRFPILAYISDKFGNDHFTKYMANGRVSVELESIHDLFFAPKKRVGWVNLHRSKRGFPYLSRIYQVKEYAEKVGIENDNYITTVKIEWEEDLP